MKITIEESEDDEIIVKDERETEEEFHKPQWLGDLLFPKAEY